MDFTSCILSISVFLGLTMGLFLLLVKSGRQHNNLVLGIMILITTTFLLPTFFYKLGILEKVPHVIRLRNLFAVAFGPLMFIYVLQCIKKDFKVTPRILLHFIPAIIAAIYFLPFLFQDGAYKMEAYLALVKAGDLGEPKIIPLLRCIYNLLYFFICLRLILVYKKNLPLTTSNIDVNYHRWLLFFSSFLLFPLLSLLLFAMNQINSLTLEFLYFTLFIFLSSVYLFMMFKPAVFHAFPHQLEAEQLEQKESKKYANSNLKNTEKEKYLQKLKVHMDAHKSYREPELTLSKLSDQVKIPTHHLSQVINEKLDCHFLEFINRYRIEEAKQKLVDHSNKQYTIEAIAYDVGFNTKSTFYSAFKKMTKTTPASYRRAIQREEV